MEYDMCFVSPDEKFAYLTIYKNASTTMYNNINKLWTEAPLSDISLKTKLTIILRSDIISRWVSGMITFLEMQKITKCEHIDFNGALINEIFSRIAFDIHTIKQCDFLKNVKAYNTQYFVLDTNFNKNINHFFHNNGCDINILGKSNVTKQKSNDEITMYSVLMNYALLPHYNNKLVNFFQKDYELIENTTFYNS